ncbi:hypothetical protein PAXRUDRAFT_143893 [Paxillus rubicundulus Ve08.2h10]|uniref:Uncharacterized protein n=1 Tax=Paxillus rubicundulus Ve08.2h10 TaxID=930991 RepID=A0A0D0E197_9AGAM|nr:hypothetical protein PAXRUDRAFT_143893 [Paxillus rubicundulus Ve08.2h10]
MSPNDDSSLACPSLLPSSSHPPVSTALTTSYHTSSKHSKVSAASDVKETKMLSTVALVGIQGSIIHLAEMVKTSFLDPMIVIWDATVMLFADNEKCGVGVMVPDFTVFCQFLLGLFTINTSIAVIYTSIPDTASCHSYIKELHNEKSEPVTDPSSMNV